MAVTRAFTTSQLDSRVDFYYTATSGQTTFSGSDDNGSTLSYTASGKKDVYLNGTLLIESDDYVATNGTSVVLQATTQAGDIVHISVNKVMSNLVNIVDTSVDLNGNELILDADGDTSITADTDDQIDIKTGGTDRVHIDSSGNVGIGTSSPSQKLSVSGSMSASNYYLGVSAGTYGIASDTSILMFGSASSPKMTFKVNGNTERMRIDDSGNLLVSKTVANSTTSEGASFDHVGSDFALRIVNTNSSSGEAVMLLNRQNSDGGLITFRQANTTEGSISVSGTTVSYNGGHLSRWGRLSDGSKPTILKGTVMSNLDEMVVWSYDDVLYTEEDELPVDDDGNPTASVGDVKTPAYTAENEQRNQLKVSDVEGDINVAGLFVKWDTEEDGYNDIDLAMTGDMVIRIAQGTTVQRGDLLMSAGDGTAKPQGDDIVRSKTIAKVTSTTVINTYDDGSYVVPCVVMAC